MRKYCAVSTAAANKNKYNGRNFIRFFTTPLINAYISSTTSASPIYGLIIRSCTNSPMTASVIKRMKKAAIYPEFILK